MDDDYRTKGGFDNNGQFTWVKTATLKPIAVPSLFNFSGYSRGAKDAPTVFTPMVSDRSQRLSRRSQEKAKREKTP